MEASSGGVSARFLSGGCHWPKRGGTRRPYPSRGTGEHIDAPDLFIWHRPAESTAPNVNSMTRNSRRLPTTPRRRTCPKIWRLGSLHCKVPKVQSATHPRRASVAIRLNPKFALSTAQLQFRGGRPQTRGR
eukprot:8129887-Alexandrium_andersonii.AAC.1